jgi:Tol biopolymer transport system component
MSPPRVRGDVVSAIEAATGRDIADLSRAWHAAIRERHGGRRDSAARARTVVGGSDSRGTLNVAPALSPDGRWLAFLSERGLFSIDLYVAEAATGRVVRRVTTSDTDPHIESLNFTASAGAWDRSSQRLAYTTITGGRAVLSIVNMADGPDRELRIDAADEAWHPTWAPDGGAIAFSGLSGRRLRPLRRDARRRRRCGASPTTRTQTCSLPGRRMAGRWCS